ncbi:hypothetical protein ACLOJK_021106 [Asimina triloba]
MGWMNKLAADGVTKLGIAVLKNYDAFTKKYWFWIGTAALLGYSILFNVLFTLALMYLNPLGKPQAVVSEAANEMEGRTEESNEERKVKRRGSRGGPKAWSLSASHGKNDREMAIQCKGGRANAELSQNSQSSIEFVTGIAPKRGMVLPFTPLTMSFDEVNYYVDMPTMAPPL